MLLPYIPGYQIRVYECCTESTAGSATAQLIVLLYQAGTGHQYEYWYLRPLFTNVNLTIEARNIISYVAFPGREQVDYEPTTEQVYSWRANDRSQSLVAKLGEPDKSTQPVF